MTGEQNAGESEDTKSGLLPMMRRMPAYAKLISALLQDPKISQKQKATLAGLGIPDKKGIPALLGRLDDLLATLVALNTALNLGPREVVEPHLKACGLTFEMMEEDGAAVRHAKDFSVTAAKTTAQSLSKLGKALLKTIQNSLKQKD